MKPCNDCPFMKSTPLNGAPDWLRDVMIGHHNKNFRHSCHKTDPKADGYKGGSNRRDCVGLDIIRMNDHDGTPGRDGVYKSIPEMVESYLRHWLGDRAFEKLRMEAKFKSATDFMIATKHMLIERKNGQSQKRQIGSR